MRALRELRVLDFSTQVAGPYCTKLMADAGADVVKVEAPQGDPLRRWSATGAELGDQDGAFFRFLQQNKRSVVGAPDDEAVLELIAGADLVVESFEPGVIDALDLPARFPGLVLLSISPYGRGGPRTHRPATEFTLQAEAGSIGGRGLPGREPFQCGARTLEWIAGTYASVAGLAAVLRARRTGHGEHVDFSILEVTTLTATNYVDLLAHLQDATDPKGPLPVNVETPSIEPTADGGFVGFCTNSAQQFSDFLVLIERPDLQGDKRFEQFTGRFAHWEEWNGIVQAWTRRHTTDEIIERASLLRIPVAPICDGESVQRHEQLVARGVFRRDPSGSFVHPRPPFRFDDQDPPAPRPAPALGEHTGRVEARERRLPEPAGAPPLPLAGLRIIDMTLWWAGPAAAQMLALLGAEVIHLEAIQRPDGMRMVGGMVANRFEQWWETSHFFLANNANKKSLTLDLGDPRGRELLERLVAVSDGLIENFTPRVLDNFGLSWERVHALNPQTILLRMPAFGLTGPWRDRPGFAQNMEQMTGLAWLTGHPDDQPRNERGPCDPLAGMHAAFAFLAALAEREARGAGLHVECTMVEAALNAAAEQLVEFSAYGTKMRRMGNRAPEAAPQGLYPCRGSQPGLEQWLALSVATDAQWAALCELLGRPAWTEDPALATLPGRRAAHDAIDAQLRPWVAGREREKLVEELLEAGIPAAPVVDPRIAGRNPQMAARGFFEEIDHPVAGRQPTPIQPFRYGSVERWARTPAPLLGQHNRELLQGLLGVSDRELAALAADGVIGDRPAGL